MPRNDRNGKRKTRDQFAGRRVPNLGYYIIVTDTKETEKNYFYGLKSSIPQELQGKLVITVKKANTQKLVEYAMNVASLHPQYGEVWIILDRDQVRGFDELIAEAQDKGLNVGWTNPCIEEWFYAYFGEMPTYTDSVKCCEQFSEKYKRMVKQQYDKSDILIYLKLNRFGDENTAIQIAEQKMLEHESNGKNKPSEKCPGTTVHLLIDEIQSKIKRR